MESGPERLKWWICLRALARRYGGAGDGFFLSLLYIRDGEESGAGPVAKKDVADVVPGVAADAVVLFLGIEVVGHGVQAYAAVSDSLKSQQEMIYAAEAA